MNPFRYSVSFRINHPTMSPGEISAKLGLKPDISWQAGDQRQTLEGVQKEKYKTTYWSYKLKYGPGVQLAECLENFTIGLEPHKDFFQKIVSQGGSCEYFVGWFSNSNSGEIFSHKLLGKFFALRIGLALDIYSAK